MKIKSSLTVLVSISFLSAGCNIGVVFKKPTISPPARVKAPAPAVAKPATPVKKAAPAPAVSVPAKAVATSPKPAPPKVAVVKSAPNSGQPVPQKLSSGRPDYSLRLINRTGEEVSIELNHGKLKLKIKPGATSDVLADASNNQIPYEAKIGNKAYADGVIKVDSGALFYTITLRL